MTESTQPVVLVTGAAGNLGRAVAKAFAATGARLALLDLSVEGLEHSAADLPTGSDVQTYPTNLTDPLEVANSVEAIVTHFGKIDVLANIAGGFTMGPLIQDTEDRDWEFMFNLNLRSVFYTCREVLPHMLAAEGGRIINISARAAKEGKGRMGPYCASKAGVITLTEALAAENKYDNINVNCILPGTIDTPQNRAAMPDANYSHWVTPEAIADVVLFLSSPAARSVTGAAIPVYGQS